MTYFNFIDLFFNGDRLRNTLLKSRNLEIVFTNNKNVRYLYSYGNLIATYDKEHGSITIRNSPAKCKKHIDWVKVCYGNILKEKQ